MFIYRNVGVDRRAERMHLVFQGLLLVLSDILDVRKNLFVVFPAADQDNAALVVEVADDLSPDVVHVPARVDVGDCLFGHGEGQVVALVKEFGAAQAISVRGGSLLYLF
jgi:hypothetical protein